MRMTFVISKKIIWAILKKVAEDMEIEAREIRSSYRGQELVEARMIISKVSSEAGCIDKQIANILKKDRTTVNHYREMAEKTMERDSKFTEYINELIEKFNQ